MSDVRDWDSALAYRIGAILVFCSYGVGTTVRREL